MSTIGDVTVRRVGKRIIPLFFALWVLSYLDRLNAGFAALQMNDDIGISPAVFGVGMGVFFIGVMIFTLPSALAMRRLGAARWIGIIAICWGLVSTAMALVNGPTSLLVLRFLLGMAEAGFMPTLILYFTGWFPAHVRARAIAILMTGAAFSIVAGAPLSVALLELDGLFGLAGWRLMFIIEGLPSILLGLFALFYLDETPQRAKWLSPEQRRWLDETLAAERVGQIAVSARASDALREPAFWRLFVFYLLCGMSFMGIAMWLPLIVKQSGDLSNAQVGLICAVPYLFAAITMVIVARHSDRTQERRLHLFWCALVGGVMMILAAILPPVPSFVALTFAAMGVWGVTGVFWAVPSTFLRDAAAVWGVALITIGGGLGGFLGPTIIGLMREASGGFAGAALVIGAGQLLAALVVLGLKSEAAALRIAPVPVR